MVWFFLQHLTGLKPNGSRAVSSHVFTRTCNMNGALSGCTRGKSAAKGSGLSWGLKLN